MHTQYTDLIVILFPGTNGGWYFAEIDGASVCRFGPFESHQAVEELVSVLFPEVPRVELRDSSDLLDDRVLMIRGNEELVAKRTTMADHRMAAKPAPIERRAKESPPSVDIQLPI
ncbi:hypothetical protein N234_31555 [Ralstonia pickettii DTP0602]|nr:hypothetical protein N234_31555 [Ralstonia pickettii DTP0602]